MNGKPRTKFLLKTFLVALAVGGGSSPSGGCDCGATDPDAQMCVDCNGSVSRCNLGGGSYTHWECTTKVNTYCEQEYNGEVEHFDCDGVGGGGTDGTDAGDDGDVTGGAADDGLDVTGAEEDWTPTEHIEPGTEPNHYDISEAFADYASTNQGLLLVGDGTVAFLDGDECIEIDVAGSLPSALGLDDGDTPRRVNGLSLHADDVSATVTAVASETDFTVDVESSAPRAWFVRPKVLYYHIE